MATGASTRSSKRACSPARRSEAPSLRPRSPFGCEPFGELDRLDQAALVGDPAARDIERGAVVDGGANNGQPERDVDTRQLRPFAGRRIDLEAEQLDRDVSLVVIHGNDRIVLT